MLAPEEDVPRLGVTDSVLVNVAFEGYRVMRQLLALGIGVNVIHQAWQATGCGVAELVFAVIVTLALADCTGAGATEVDWALAGVVLVATALV